MSPARASAVEPLITSTRNPNVAAAAKLKKRALREKERRFLVEGAQATQEALSAGAVQELFHTAGQARIGALAARAGESGARVLEVSERVMAHLTSTVTPQGIVAVAGFVDVALAQISADHGIVPVLCAVRDPGNAGTVLRSADAAGAGAVVFAGTSVDVYNPKAVRASAGSLFHLPVVRGVQIEEAVAALRERGARILAAAPGGDASVYDTDLTGPTAVLLGNEAWGLTPEATRLADARVRVPIHGRAESLNLAAAAALVMFEAARQREAAGDRASAGTLAQLISGAAHDIRQPLTALKGFAATLAANWERLADAERREFVGALALDGERVAALIKLMIDVARLEEDVVRFAAERRDLAAAAEWVAGVFSRSREYPEIRVIGSAEAFADHDRVQSILVVLCEAARWFGEEGPIEVRVGTGERTVWVEVARSGGGPTAEEASHLFGRPDRGGRIGLALGRIVAEAQGGSITAEAGDGIRLRLTLPG